MLTKQAEKINLDYKDIPRQDLINGLPIRWAAHCSNNDGSPRPPEWKFSEWRDYLMEATGEALDGHIANIRHILYGGGTDRAFPQEVRNFLAYHEADTLAGFIRFWTKCCQDYKQLLIEDSII